MRRFLPLVLTGFLVAAGFVSSGLLIAADAPDIESLVRDLKSTKADQRHRPRRAGKLGPRAAPAVAPLVAALRDKNPEVQFEALIALEHIGPAARSAVPELVKLLESPQQALVHGRHRCARIDRHDARKPSRYSSNV